MTRAETKLRIRHFMWAVLYSGLAMASPEPEAPAPEKPSSGNISNDKLLEMPEYGQAAMLSKATGYRCIGKNPYYMGTETAPPNAHVSLWSIRCANTGTDYLIAIAPDATGSTKVISCKLLHKQPWKCYEKIEH